jgi:hypothetical protein
VKDSDSKNNRGKQLVEPNRSITVSERKLKANRENAKRSTGPRTSLGKAYSRRNAVKHVLFVRPSTDFEAQSEDAHEYENLLNGLWRQHRPVGRAEEIEVERVALCCWRLKRAWRYENAVNLAARRDFVRAELAEQEPYCKERDKEEAAVILQLQSAKKELEEGGVEISQELKQRTCALMPGLEALWSALEKRAQERLEKPDLSKRALELSPDMRSWVLSMFTVTNGIAFVQALGRRRWTNVVEAAVGRHAIPNGNALDQILRYEAAIDRQLGRALDRLERLQRRRQGEMIPPPVSVRLTRS